MLRRFRRTAVRQGPLIETLEDRVLFNAAPVAIPLQEAADADIGQIVALQGDDLVQTNWAEGAFSRFTENPLELYSFEAVETMVDAIRAEGHMLQVGHPRIFIRADNKNELRDKIQTHYLDWYQDLVDMADIHWGQDLLDPGGNSDQPEAQPVVLANALIYQLGALDGAHYRHSIDEYGREGVRHLVNLATIDGRYSHRSFLGMPLGYDWLYELMNHEQRLHVATRLLEYAQPDNDLIKPYNNPAGIRLMGALAVYGDDHLVDPVEVQETLSLFYNGMVFGDPFVAGLDKGKVRIKYANITGNMMFVSEGPGVEGLSYSAWYLPFYPLLLAWRDQTGEDYFQLPFFQNWTLQMTHLTGNEYEHFDKSPKNKKKSFAQVNRIYEIALAESNRDMASLARHHALFQPDKLDPSLSPLYILLADPTLEARSPAELDLPTTAHFDTINNVLARNSWSGTETTWAWFQSPTWEQRKGGPLNDLVIWKNNAMLLGHHVNRHSYSGGNRTNTIVLYDERYPHQTFVPNNVIDSAGNRQKDDRDPEALAHIDESAAGYHEGLRFFEEQPGEYVYAFGDGGQTFMGTAGSPDDPQYFAFTNDEVDLPGWSRQFIWFRNDHNDEIDQFIVLDRVDKGREDLTEQLRFNFADNPEIRNRETNRSVGDGRELVKGIYEYQGADRIVADNTVGLTEKIPSDGRLFMDTLLPADPVYYRMGGIHERNIDLYGNLRRKSLQMNEEDPDSRQNLLNGMWRVQMGTPERSDKTIYLNVLQATDTSVDRPHDTVLLEGQGIVGAAVGGNIALFNPFESTLQAGRLVTPDGLNGVHRLLVSDLDPGARYELKIDGRAIHGRASERGTLFLKDLPIRGGLEIQITQTGHAPAPPAPPQEAPGSQPEPAFPWVPVPGQPSQPDPPEQDIPDPVVPDPVVPDPVLPDPVVPDPVLPDPVVPDPVLPDPVVPDPVLPDPVVPNPVVPDPVAPDPVVPDPVVPDPVVPDPVVPDPVVPDPVVPDPVVPDPVPQPELPLPPEPPQPPAPQPDPPQPDPAGDEGHHPEHEHDPIGEDDLPEVDPPEEWFDNEDLLDAFSEGDATVYDSESLMDALRQDPHLLRDAARQRGPLADLAHLQVALQAGNRYVRFAGRLEEDLLGDAGLRFELFVQKADGRQAYRGPVRMGSTGHLHQTVKLRTSSEYGAQILVRGEGRVFAAGPMLWFRVPSRDEA